MNKITLNYVPGVTDLSVRYARDLGNNKVKHYTLPMNMALALSGTSLTKTELETLVKNHINNSEGSSEIEFVYEDNKDVHKTEAAGAMRVTDHFDLFKSIRPDLYKVLTKGYTSASVLEYQELPVGKLNILKHKINTFLNLIVKTTRSLFGLKQNNNFVNYTNVSYTRNIAPAVCLAVKYSEGKLNEAMNILIKDLETLNKLDAIAGSLSLPFSVHLADVVGIGPKQYVLAAYPFIKENKLFGRKTTNSSMEDLYLFLGVISVTPNGLSPKNFGLTSEFQIEEELVKTSLSLDDIQKILVDQHITNTKIINEAAAKQSAEIKNYEAKIVRHEIEFGKPTSTLHIEVTRKSGDKNDQ